MVHFVADCATLSIKLGIVPRGAVCHNIDTHALLWFGIPVSWHSVYHPQRLECVAAPYPVEQSLLVAPVVVQKLGTEERCGQQFAYAQELFLW